MVWSRESRQSRGYGAAWDRLRARVLATEPLCRHCRAKGRVTVATQVDHIRPKAQGGTDDLGNVQPLCRPCHEAKTDAENGRTVKAKVVIGSDGYPCDPLGGEGRT